MTGIVSENILLAEGILESITDGFYALDRGWRFTNVNHEAECILGRGRDELLGQNIWELFPRLAENEIGRQLKRASIEGTTVKFEAFSETLQMWLSLSVYPFDGGLSVFSRDVTEKVALEDGLRQAQKMEAVGQLAGGVAHDFNNLLTAIIGYAELTLCGGQTARQVRQNSVEIRDAAQRAALLTNQLLAFSRRLMLRPRELDLNELVAGMLEELRQLTGVRMEIEVTSGPDLATVMADPGQLRQVLVNLVSNAADSMPEGGHLRISTNNAELVSTVVTPHDIVPPGRYVCLTVSDEGHGMNEEMLQRAFEPFFTTKDVGEGTGLGLSTVFGIVKQSGGYVTAESEKGAGTTIRVYLPRLDHSLK